MPHATESHEVDVFICGSGSAGLCAATWLAKYGVRCKIVDSRPGPLERGQADGVQVRSVEIFESFGIVEELLREGYHNIEVGFWVPKEDGGGIFRARSAPATTPGLSHLPRVILNQARFNEMLLQSMKRFNNQNVDYSYRVLDVKVDESKLDDSRAYPVTVVTEKDGKEERFNAKYVLGCDGAHSAVRRSLGYKMVGDTSDSIWGVMDVFPQTNFPDIRKQTIIQSDTGSIVTVPREGEKMVRFYVEFGAGTNAKTIKLEDIQHAARSIVRPYKLDFADTYWWSAYPIGQRVADYFSKANRVFLTGDACHTHSPKAGQGMNVSLQDGFNIGWKLASVLKGQAQPDLLQTYVLEREKVAHTLINWDKEWAQQLSSMHKDEGGVVDADGKIDFSEIFVKAEAFTAGLTITYDDSPATNGKGSKQELATNLKAGMRVQSTQVVRMCDAKAMQLTHALPADGRWRILVFAGDIKQQAAFDRLNQLGKYLFSGDGPIRKHLPAGYDIDSFIEVVLVLSGDRLKLEMDQIPECFYPVTGKWRMHDIQKIYFDEESYHQGHGHAYEFYGISPDKGAVAITRPDNYISMVLSLDDHTVINNFFEGFAIAQK